jgi:hypothetical protein
LRIQCSFVSRVRSTVGTVGGTAWDASDQRGCGALIQPCWFAG